MLDVMLPAVVARGAVAPDFVDDPLISLKRFVVPRVAPMLDVGVFEEELDAVELLLVAPVVPVVLELLVVELVELAELVELVLLVLGVAGELDVVEEEKVR